MWQSLVEIKHYSIMHSTVYWVQSTVAQNSSVKGGAHTHYVAYRYSVYMYVIVL